MFKISIAFEFRHYSTNATNSTNFNDIHMLTI